MVFQLTPPDKKELVEAVIEQLISDGNVWTKDEGKTQRKMMRLFDQVELLVSLAKAAFYIAVAWLAFHLDLISYVKDGK